MPIHILNFVSMSPWWPRWHLGGIGLLVETDEGPVLVDTGLGLQDYTRPGGYFITIVVHGRNCLFGEVVSEEMQLNALGRIAYGEWFKTSEIRPYVELRPEEFVVIPNHVQGIIWILDHAGAERRSAPALQPRVLGGSLGAIARDYKSAVTYAIHACRGTRGEAIWQRNYYEHILRDQADWENVCAYIRSNPLLWGEGEENPWRLLQGDKP